MGCCSSIPSQEEGETSLNNTTTTTTASPNNHRSIQQPQIQESTQLQKPQVTITRASSSLHSMHNVEKDSPQQEESDNRNSNDNTSSSVTSSASTTWPIFVRLSSNGQDITVQVPTLPPYLTVSGLRQELLPHLEKNARVKLIYLGRILPDQHVIVPTQTDADVPLPPPKNKAIQIQREGVIQAMVTKA